jgi:hypothetical protein
MIVFAVVFGIARAGRRKSTTHLDVVWWFLWSIWLGRRRRHTHPLFIDRFLEKSARTHHCLVVKFSENIKRQRVMGKRRQKLERILYITFLPRTQPCL